MISRYGPIKCYPVEVNVFGLGVYDNVVDERESLIIDDEPIESIVFKGSANWKKCFTFFSHTRETWRQTRRMIKRISIKVIFKNLWYPISDFQKDGYEIAVHNPDEWPQDMLMLDSFKDIDINYNMVVTNQSDAKDIVQCVDYDLDSGQPRETMQTECLKHCMQDLQEQCTNCSRSEVKCLFHNPYQWTRDQIGDSKMRVTNLHYFDCYGSELRFEAQCKARCRTKCVNRVYSHQMKSSVDSFESSVHITHSQLPDQLTELKPKMSWIDFFSQLGGLFGLWLGLSLYAISGYVVKLFTMITKPVSKEVTKTGHLKNLS